MTDLIRTTNNITTIIAESTNATSVYPINLYQVIQGRRWLSFYKNRTKYFLFGWKGRILCLSEYELCLILGFLIFFGVISIRLLIRQFKLRKRRNRCIQKLRGGEKEILHYENELNSNGIPNYRLSERQYYLASVVNKCLKPGHIYKIVDHQLNEVIDKMLDFKKANNLKMISYDVFVVALYVSSKTSTTLIYNGMEHALRKVKVAALAEWMPMIGFLLVILRLGIRMDINQRVVDWVIPIISGFVQATATYSGLSRLRSQFLIDCTDYILELPEVNKQELPYVQALPDSDSSSKMCYMREEPDRHQAYVSTSPNTELYYQQDIKNDIQIKTLDGTIKQTQQLNGKKSLTWVKDRKPQNLNSNKYIRLEGRTKTLKDLKHLDTSATRKAAEEITEYVQKKQQLARLIEESLESLE